MMWGDGKWRHQAGGAGAGEEFYDERHEMMKVRRRRRGEEKGGGKWISSNISSKEMKEEYCVIIRSFIETLFFWIYLFTYFFSVFVCV